MASKMQNLLNCGYSHKDILDLVVLFETQIKFLVSQLDSLDEEEIHHEMHKLRGGCELLSFTDEALIINELSKKTTEKKNQISKINELLSNMQTSLEHLKYEINSNKN